MKDHTDKWVELEELYRRRNTDPIEVVKEYLRDNGYIVERPENVSIPIDVRSTGSFTRQDNYTVTLYVRATIGDRKAQVGYSIEINNSLMPAKAFSSTIVRGFSDLIAKEIAPQIEAQCERELAKHKETPPNP